MAGEKILLALNGSTGVELSSTPHAMSALTEPVKRTPHSTPPAADANGEPASATMPRECRRLPQMAERCHTSHRRLRLEREARKEYWHPSSTRLGTAALVRPRGSRMSCHGGWRNTNHRRSPEAIRLSYGVLYSTTAVLCAASADSWGAQSAGSEAGLDERSGCPKAQRQR